MKPNLVKQALREGKFQLGVNFGQFRSPEIAKMLAAAGFHWAFLDTEHGGFDLETVQDICRVANLAGLCPLVRVADIQYALVARALDCGAQGVIFPRVESPELLATAVSWARFPPDGVRGYGLMAVHIGYEKAGFSEIIRHTNDNTMVVLQIETQRAVEARRELLAVPGLDAVMVGPADLSISLGVPGEFLHPKVVEAVEMVRDACLEAGVAPGIQTRSADVAAFWKARGMRFVGCGSEAGMLYERACQIAAELL